MDERSGVEPMMAGVAVDHIVIAVDDLASAAAQLTRLTALTASGGGTHERWGTQNRLFSLGDCYLELVTVVDRQAAAASEFGSWVAETMGPGLMPTGWAVRTQQLDATAERLGLPVEPGSRRGPDGQSLSWRLAGVAQARRTGFLPFFISWDGAPPFADEHTPLPRLGGLSPRVDPARLARWLGGHAARVRCSADSPVALTVDLDTPHGTVSLPSGEEVDR